MFFSRSIPVSSNLIGLLSICFLSVSSVATVVFLLLIIFYIDTTHFHHHHQTFKELGHSLTRSGSIPGGGQRIFPVASVSRPALGPTQRPVQWVPEVLSPGLKRGRGVTLTTHPYLVPRSRMSRSYTSCPPKRLHGVWWDSFSFYISALYLHVESRCSYILGFSHYRFCSELF
jgi:hypothetical protein